MTNEEEDDGDGDDERNLAQVFKLTNGENCVYECFAHDDDKLFCANVSIQNVRVFELCVVFGAIGFYFSHFEYKFVACGFHLYHF